MFDFNFTGSTLKVGRASVLKVDDDQWYSVRFMPDSGKTYSFHFCMSGSERKNLLEALNN